MVQGLDRLERRMKAVPAAVREEVSRAMEKAAQEIVRDMRQRAPVMTGDLVRSIDWTWGDAPAGAITIGSSNAGKAYGTMRLTFYAGGSKTGTLARPGEQASRKKYLGDTFYGRFQEFGTKNMPANPFFFPTWRVWRRRAQSRIRAAITRAIKKNPL